MAGAQKGELTKIGFQEGDPTLENQIEYLLLHFLNFTVLYSTYSIFENVFNCNITL